MKKLLGIIVLGLLFSGNAYAEKISVMCIDKKSQKKSYISFYNEKGKKKVKLNGDIIVDGFRKSDNENASAVTVITIDEKNLSAARWIQDEDFVMHLNINRFTGEMHHYGNIGKDKFSYNAICKKSTDEKSF